MSVFLQSVSFQVQHKQEHGIYLLHMHIVVNIAFPNVSWAFACYIVNNKAEVGYIKHYSLREKVAQDILFLL